MEKLVKNIARLIAQHNCVIVPGMGAFLAHRVPAYYNAEEKVFMPSQRTLGFNPQVTVDDALLLSEYMSDGLLSYEEANDVLARDIDSLRNKLAEAGIVYFGDLGTFSMDIKGKISFTPNEHCIDDPYNYGFEPFSILPLKELKKKDIVIKRSSISRYVSAVAAAIIAIFVLIPFGDSIYDTNIELSVAGFTSVESKIKPTTTNVVAAQEAVCEITPVEETVTAHIFTTNAESVFENAEPAVIDATEVVAVEETVSVEPVTPVVQYSIIVASTPNPKNAQLAITELTRKMKADYKVVEGERRFRIAIESYNSEAEANIALERIQATFSDAWVYVH